LIKGNVHPRETLEHAIQSEIREETGIIFSESRLQRLPCKMYHTHMFVVSVSSLERQAIEAHIRERERRHKGELFHVGFYNPSQIDRTRCNHVTQTVLKSYVIEPVVIEPGKEDGIDFEDLLESAETDTDPKPTPMYDPLYEPPFVWGKPRVSLLRIPVKI
jgi:8-oxo-dGTP pyrophosphatase MutT (NUDIX family)